MKGYTIASILFCSNILLLYNIFGLTNINDPLEILLYSWLEISLLVNITKLLYNYNKNLICKYTIYLVNKNKSIWNSDYPVNVLLPWNFMMLLLADYIANCDREYTFLINNWYVDIYSNMNLLNITLLSILTFIIITYTMPYTILLIIISLLFQMLSFILYLDYYLKLDINNNIDFIITGVVLLSYGSTIFNANMVIMGIVVLQLIQCVLYNKDYIEQSYIIKRGSLNQDSIDFPCGKLMINRPLYYINLLWFIIPCVILYNKLLL